MKAIAYQPHRSRSSSRPQHLAVSLPGGADLHDGALVPLLLAITRTARRQAESAALAKASEVDSQVQMEQEKVQWRIAQFKNSRRTTENQLADARLELGHIEDHTHRRLGEQLARYKQTIDDFQRLSAADTQQRTKVEESLKQTQAKVVVAEQELAETRRTAAQRNRSYSVVPYEGPNQTHRRPIYLECRGDAVVLQPEGIQLVDSDFEGPLGPGNPLAALLRAAREYLLSQHGFDPQTGEPYPMLLVRPEGIAAYYAALRRHEIVGIRLWLRTDRRRLEIELSAGRFTLGRSLAAGSRIGARGPGPADRGRTAAVSSAIKRCLSSLAKPRWIRRGRRFPRQ